MPVMDGYEATRKIRLQEQFKKLPIIAMTANARPEDRMRSIAAGMNDHISKPIAPETLFHSLSKWLKVKPMISGKEQVANNNSSSLPAIKGLDMAKGLHHTANKEALYVKVMKKFAVTNDSAATKIDELLLAGETEKAARIAHSLKGISGTIGASSLQQLADKVQQAINQNKKTDIKLHLAVLEKELSDVITDIKVKL